MAAVIDLTPEVMRKNFMEINYENVKDSNVFIHQQYVEVYERIKFLVESEKGEKGEGLKGVFVSGPRGSGKSTIVFNLLKDLEGSGKNLGGELQVVGEIVDLPSVKISVLVWFLNYLIDLAQGKKADDANVCDDTTLVKLMDLTKKIEVIVRGENMDMWDLVNSSVRKIRKEIGDIARTMLKKMHKKFFFLVVDDIDIATGEVIAKFLREVYFFLGEVPLILVGVGDYDNLLKILCVYEMGLLGISKTENDICWKTSEKERIIEQRVKAKVEKVFGVVHRLKLLKWEGEIRVKGEFGEKSLREYIRDNVEYGYLFTEREEYFLLQNLSLRQIVQMLARVEEIKEGRRTIKYHELFEVIAPDVFVGMIPAEEDEVKRYLLFVRELLERVRWVYGDNRKVIASNIWAFLRKVGLSVREIFVLKQYYREIVFSKADEVFVFPVMFNRILDMILVNAFVVHIDKEYDFNIGIFDVLIEFVNEFECLYDRNWDKVFEERGEEEEEEEEEFSEDVFVSLLGFYEYLWRKILSVSEEDVEELISENKKGNKEKGVHNSLIKAGIFPEVRSLGFVGDFLVVKMEYPSSSQYKGIVGSLTIAMWMVFYHKVLGYSWYIKNQVQVYDTDEEIFSEMLYASLADDRRISEIRIRHISFGKGGQGRAKKVVGLETVFLLATAIFYDPLDRITISDRDLVDVRLYRKAALNIDNIFKEKGYEWEKFIFSLYVSVGIIAFHKSRIELKKEEVVKLVKDVLGKIKENGLIESVVEEQEKFSKVLSKIDDAIVRGLKRQKDMEKIKEDIEGVIEEKQADGQGSRQGQAGKQEESRCKIKYKEEIKEVTEEISSVRDLWKFTFELKSRFGWFCVLPGEVFTWSIGSGKDDREIVSYKKSRVKKLYGKIEKLMKREGCVKIENSEKTQSRKATKS